MTNYFPIYSHRSELLVQDTKCVEQETILKKKHQHQEVLKEELFLSLLNSSLISSSFKRLQHLQPTAFDIHKQELSTHLVQGNIYVSNFLSSKYLFKTQYYCFSQTVFQRNKKIKLREVEGKKSRRNKRKPQKSLKEVINNKDVSK